MSEVVSEEGNVFDNCLFDGIVGLAYPEMAAIGKSPLFDNIKAQNQLESNTFSFYLDHKKPQIVFGDIDFEMFEGPLTWHSVPACNQYYW